jgi:hypothetical protein
MASFGKGIDRTGNIMQKDYLIVGILLVVGVEIGFGKEAIRADKDTGSMNEELRVLR